MGIKTRCAVLLIAWLIFLHLVFSLVPQLRRLPVFVKICIAVGITASGSALAYTPVLDLWREEMAGALTGRLRPDGDANRSDIVFQVGPNAAGQLDWTGDNNPQLAALGSYIRFDRNKQGELVVNTVIRDRDGHMLVEIVDNEWRVASSSWEKNYTKDALEVKDGDGRIVFQLRLLPDRAEIQAEWWNRDGRGKRIVQDKLTPDALDSDKKGLALLDLTPSYHPDEPAIKPIFRYPSKKYFGMLKQP
jgi:hypothetical protein